MYRNFLPRMAIMVSGLFVMAVATVFQINAQLGYSSWTVLSDGVAKRAGWTMGVASIIIGAVIILIDLLARQNIGMATLCNMYLVGTFQDMIQRWGLVPLAGSLGMGVVYLFVSMVLMAISCWMYIGVGYGAGPRDSLMLAAIRITRKPLGLCRTTLELGALAAGWLLGGSVGIGTVLVACCNGYIMQTIFQWVHFDTKKVQHVYLSDQLRALRARGKAGQEAEPAAPGQP